MDVYSQPMNPSIKSMRYFLTATELGSISRAAEQLNVAPSAVSNAIDTVERAFEMRLMQRYPAKGISLTAAGVALMHKIRHLLEEYDGLLLEGAELRTALSGNLTIGYYAPVAPAFMPSIVGPLVRDNPDVRLSFIDGDNERVQSGLLNGEFDVIVFVAANTRTGIVWETLIDAPPYILLPEGHPLSERTFIEVDDISREPLVLLDLPFTSGYISNLIDTHSLQSRIVARASTTEMVRSLVGAGLGCSILNMRPSSAATYADDRVVAVPLRTASPHLRLVVGRLGGKPRRLVQTFIKASKQYFSQSEAGRLVVTSSSA